MATVNSTQKADAFQYATSNRKKVWRMCLDIVRQAFYVSGALFMGLVFTWLHTNQEVILLAVKNNQTEWINWPDFVLWGWVCAWVGVLGRLTYYAFSKESDTSIITDDKVKEGKKILNPGDAKNELKNYFKRTGEKPFMRYTDEISASRNIEGKHTLLAAPTRSGKTTSVILPKIIQCYKAGVKSFVIDPGGVILSHLLSDDCDIDKSDIHIVGNPYDARNKYIPCGDYLIADYDGKPHISESEFGSFSATIFPEGAGESSEFFNYIGRSALTDIIYALSETINKEGQRVSISYANILRFIKLNKDSFREIMQKHELDAESLYGSHEMQQGDAQSHGHEGTFMKYLDGFRLMSKVADNEKFSIYRWVRSDKPSIVIMPSQDNDQFMHLQNVQSLIFTNTLRMKMSYGFNNDPIEFFLEEIDEWRRMPILTRTASKGSKYGIWLNLSVQSLSLLKMSVSQDFINALVGDMRGVKIVWKTDEPEAAKYWSDVFSGNVKSRLNISLNETDDENKRASGRTYSDQQENSAVVRVIDIQNLNEYEVILKIENITVKTKLQAVKIEPIERLKFILNPKFLRYELTTAAS